MVNFSTSTVKFINKVIKHSTKKEIDDIALNANFTARQEIIFTMRYLKGYDIDYIADSLGLSKTPIDIELKIIRYKIEKLIK